MTTTLPGDLADPLHLQLPGLDPTPAVVAAVALAAAALAGWWLWRRRRAAGRVPAPVPAEKPPPPRRESAIGERIEELRGRHTRARTYRDGCHELSAALRGHLDAAGPAGNDGLRWSTATAGELRRAAGDRPATRLLDLLAGLQFGRAAPGRGDFHGACDLAREVAADRRRGRRR